jgi:hypothetical protein
MPDPSEATVQGAHAPRGRERARRLDMPPAELTFDRRFDEIGIADVALVGG